ncbi:MAG: guanylate kinase [Clostridia bacterium]
MNKGKLFVISGPSGAGKGSVLSELFKINTTTHLSISATTRTPRSGEIEGVHYFFYSKEDFNKLIKNHQLIEYTKFCDNYYGTPIAPVNDALLKGENIILEIETDGAMQVKSKFNDAILIFIMPPSIKELEKRLSGRQTETIEVIKKRLDKAREEMLLCDQYDYIIVNEDLETAAKQLDSLIKSFKGK